MSIYDTIGVRTIINAKGTSTRVSGALLTPEVTAAMQEAAQYCVDMAEIQAAASKIIAEATGAEAGIVTSGAAAGLLLGTAACVAGATSLCRRYFSNSTSTSPGSNGRPPRV